MSRHRSRYRAVQILYQIDMRNLPPEEAIRAYYDTLYSEEHEQPQRADEFMEELVYGTHRHRADIDVRIEQHSANWKLDRMPVVDRNLLRMAIYEILSGNTPAAIVIDEALELARRMSGDEAVKFVNGVLDAVRKAHSEPRA
ncbi:MAG TPA: transcription antitermination factor NusB [Bryobacteraceae bacterium]|nr:transcription antitermination factor NusB [Bryobacteraceae bacterium]